jgi:hypothetical protein
MACVRARSNTVPLAYRSRLRSMNSTRKGSMTLFPALCSYWSLYFPNYKATAIVKHVIHNGIFNNVVPALGMTRPPCLLAERNSCSYGVFYRNSLRPLFSSGYISRKKSVLAYTLCQNSLLVLASLEPRYQQYIDSISTDIWTLSSLCSAHLVLCRGQWPNVCAGCFSVDIFRAFGVWGFTDPKPISTFRVHCGVAQSVQCLDDRGSISSRRNGFFL